MITKNGQDPVLWRTPETADILQVGDGARIRLYPRAGRATLVIAHPDQARDWLHAGVSPLAAIKRV